MPAFLPGQPPDGPSCKLCLFSRISCCVQGYFLRYGLVHSSCVFSAAVKVLFQKFLNRYHGKKLEVLELGVGWRNQLIKAPLMRLVASEPGATYVTINLGEVYIADNIQEKSFGLDGQLAEQLSLLRKAMRDRPAF